MISLAVKYDLISETHFFYIYDQGILLHHNTEPFNGGQYSLKMIMTLVNKIDFFFNIK